MKEQPGERKELFQCKKIENDELGTATFQVFFRRKRGGAEVHKAYVSFWQPHSLCLPQELL